MTKTCFDYMLVAQLLIHSCLKDLRSKNKVQRSSAKEFMKSDLFNEMCDDVGIHIRYKKKNFVFKQK